jgi:hypothetical protein
MTQEKPPRVVVRTGDLEYVRSEFHAIQTPSENLPKPSYYDAEGNAYVPKDYDLQESDRRRFDERSMAEIARLDGRYDAAWIAEQWTFYWSGEYGMCLKSATPENIVRKNWLIDRIATLIGEPHQEVNLRDLREAVDALDAIERPFCDFDREYFGGPVSRDKYVTATRKDYPIADS